MRRAEIVAALTALGTQLSERGIDGEVYVVGGAAIAMAFDARRATRDADGVLAVAEAVYGDRLDAAARFFVEELFATE